VCTHEGLRRCAALVAIALLLPLPGRSQWDAPPRGRLAPLTSGPASVPLVATLESLSVSALPAALPLSTSGARVAPVLTVTTAWTIRANCTTLRVSGYSGALAAFERDPLSVSLPDATGRVLPDPGVAAPVKDTDWPGIAQSVGPGNRPGSRTDNLSFAIDRRRVSSSDSPPSAIYILAQAL
jgi:hypothetical protein